MLLFSSVSIICLGQKEERNANYHYKSNNFYVAVNLYEKLYYEDSTNAQTIYRYAESLLKCKQKPALVLHLLNKVDSANNSDPNYQFYKAQAFLYNHNFDKAISTFKTTANLAVKDPELLEKTKLWESYAMNAKKMVKSPIDVSFVNLGKFINSEMDELTPFISSDDEMLFYTTNDKYDTKYMLYSNNVFFSAQKNGVFAKGKSLSAVNSMDDEFMAGISTYDDAIFVQLQGYEAYQDIMESERAGKAYRGKMILNENVNSKAPEFAACETMNGDTLIFSSQRPEGFGGTDLYYSLKLPDGTWSVARNLGDKINTPYDEDFPVVSANGKKLYFTSNNPNSMGGFDIFVSEINKKDRTFTTPKNLGYPLNDTYDNKTIAFRSDNRYAYVSAIRPDGFGNNDLYRVVFNQKDPSVRIYMLNFVKGTKEQKEKFAASDTTLQIKVMKKGKVVFGEYAYDSKNSQATIALPPGFYSVEIKGQHTEEHSFKVTVPDVPSNKKIFTKDVFLKPN